MNVNIILKYETIFLFLFWSSQVNCMFLQKSHASTFLSRIRRANDGLEELLHDNMERECVEERCSSEEVQEVLRNSPMPDQFWISPNGSIKPLPCFLSQSPFAKNNLKDIHSIGKKILEKQREVVDLLQQLIKRKQSILEWMKNLYGIMQDFALLMSHQF
ncbi:growth arrest-specific protein 6-like [Rhincodon typus]|uniref:growth arrest-specific protein 6-like n=1 Tax=Rhincodon typus TaxID=259920 RepID=UPI002030AA80|nr:growth arrest-specific protein 6-like [Rhincodon typus]